MVKLSDRRGAALRYVIFPPSAPVAIPGAKSLEQAAADAAAAGDRLLTAQEIDGLLAQM